MKSLLIDILMFVHIAAGLLCLAIGPVAMLAKPKGGGRHRLAGRAFMVLMGVLAATAFALLVFRWNPFFFALAVLSFYLAFSGWRVLRRKRPDRDPTQRATRTDWLTGIATIGVGIVSVFWWQRGVFGNEAAIVLGMLGFAVGAAGFDLYRFANPRFLSRWPGFWLIEHLTKISGAYIACACAFTGTVMGHFLPIALAQTWPAIIGTPLLIFVARQYWNKMNRSAPP
jgi:uncharacterized membrane protein